jgi:hypothetical protein
MEPTLALKLKLFPLSTRLGAGRLTVSVTGTMRGLLVAPAEEIVMEPE